MTQKDQYEIAELLIQYKANIDEHENTGGHVPIHWAIDSENTRFLKLFLENGASIRGGQNKFIFELEPADSQNLIHYTQMSIDPS